MECQNCNEPNPAGQKFCGNCGQPLSAVCAKCSTTNPPGQKFCGDCGHDLSQPAEVPAEPPPSKASPTADGERRQATVLFSDLSGYTAMNERLDP
ncbi:MAG: zinc ribbon domain-containing protein, partial [SAR324 cluster bacterium]|nr:zinc ribbon domain-containing protein [SAR324 cluster bacterium]